MAVQQAIESDLLPLLKKPLEAVGKQIELPGSYWQLGRGRMSEEESATKFKCAIRDFSFSQRVPGEPTPVKAFQLQEMGETGSGSLEEGDASGEIWWMKYPYPFLEYYYDTFPLAPTPADAADVSTDATDATTTHPATPWSTV